MSSWKKYFSAVPNASKPNRQTGLVSGNSSGSGGGTSSKYSSYLPEVYSGAPNRVERYIQYESMDLDSEISKSLDIISNFSTQNFDNDQEPFTINYKGDLSDTEVTLLKDTLSQWCSLNKWQQRLWRAFRNTVKYGDQVYIRDPETFELIWIDPTKVEKIIVNENRGKDIEQYVIRDIDLNLQSLVGTSMMVHDQYSFPGGYPRSSNPAAGAGTVNYSVSSSPGSRNSRFNLAENNWAVDGEHVVHLSLSEGMDSQWPFGTSILESIYKVYKQKDLLEDSVIIYRIVRAPERRIFYIDVGNLQGPRAMQYVERIKNEIYQRRIPNRTGGGQSILDAAYSPIAINEDFFMAQNAEGKGSRIETLPGGENLGCFSLDTKIRLLDGRDISIEDIDAEMKDGKQLWTFSCHPITGEIAPGKISWAGKTQSNAKVLRLTLDTGETITCTPEHKFPIRGVGFVEARDLVIGQSLTALYTKNVKINKNKKPEYTQFYNHIDSKWQFVHRMVATYMKSAGEDNNYCHNPDFINKVQNVVHHIDFNRYNNTPENLTYMSWVDHKQYHQEIGFSAESQKMGSMAACEKIKWMKLNDPEAYNDYIAKQVKGRKIWRDKLTLNERDELISKLRNGIKNHFNNLTDEKRIALKSRNLIKGIKGGQRHKLLMEIDADYKMRCSDAIRCGQQLSMSSTPEVWSSRNTAISKANYKRWANGDMNHVHQSQQLKYTDLMLKKITQFYSSGNHQLIEIVDSLNSDVEFIRYWKQINSTAHNTIKFNGFGIRHIHSILESFGLDWDRFRVINTPVTIDSTDHNFRQLMTFVKHAANQADFAKLSGTSRHKLLKIASKYGLTDYRLVKAYADTLNHRVVKIEYLTETMDVGTLTVDGDEQYHDYHTYALSVGVFVKNSIDDLRYFNNKMIRGLGIPSSYLPTGPEDGTMAFSDGKVGTAFVQEYSFTKHCQRLQNLIAPVLDREFKMFLKHRGIEISSNLFDLQFWEPQSFGEYRQIQKDSEHIGLFTSIMGSDAAKYISKRFALTKYLGWTEEDILENEHMFKEENADRVKAKTGRAPSDEASMGLSGVGIRNDMGGGDIGEMPGIPGETPPEVGTPESGAMNNAATAETPGSLPGGEI